MELNERQRIFDYSDVNWIDLSAHYHIKMTIFALRTYVYEWVVNNYALMENKLFWETLRLGEAVEM